MEHAYWVSRKTASGSAPAGMALLFLLVSMAGGPARAQDAHGHAHSDEALGAVSFGVTCSEATEHDFDRAMSLLHHMQYEEARSAFEAIAEADPACAMAHWGVAMTLFQPLWPTRPGPDVLQRGWTLVEDARALGPGSPREAALVEAAAAFYREPESADWWTRIRRWHEGMGTAYAAYPDDIETAALYALSELAAGQVAEDRMAYHARAAALLLSIHDRAPTYPGAIHYTIHANDVDARAGESPEVVRSYAEIAPSVPHALHMPSHIYVR